MTLWSRSNRSAWNHALSMYNSTIANQDVNRLVELDSWYHNELPKAIKSRPQPHVSATELAKLTEWKMKRGEWRARNLVLVRSNPPELVIDVTANGLATIPHPTKPISVIATLAGVGPATASAVVAAFAPEHYPFFDELVAAAVPELGDVKWTLGYYARYAGALREKAAELGAPFTAAMVEQALWAESGGKAGRT